MRWEVSRPIIIAAVVGLMVIVGFIGFRLLRPGTAQADHERFLQHQQMKDAKNGP